MHKLIRLPADEPNRRCSRRYCTGYATHAEVFQQEGDEWTYTDHLCTPHAHSLANHLTNFPFSAKLPPDLNLSVLGGGRR